MANELTCLVNVDPISVLTTPGAVLPLLVEIEKECRSHILTAEDEDGRNQIRSLANRIARSKTFVDDAGKDHVAVIKKQAGLIDAERKIYRDRMDSLKEEIRAPLTEWENQEQARLDAHTAGIQKIEISVANIDLMTVADLDSQIAGLKAHYEGRQWEEFADQASTAYNVAAVRLSNARTARVQYENDQAELKAMREKQEERDRADRDKKIADDAAENARQESAAKLKKAEEDKVKLKAKAAADKEAAEADAKRREEAAAQKVRDDAAAAKKAEDDATAAREKDRNHKKKINNLAKEAIEAVILAYNDAKDTEELPMMLVKAIAGGKIPNVKISY